MRIPSINTSVELTVRPRSETPAPPEPKPLANAEGIEPELSAEIDRIASATLVMPAFSRFSFDSVVIGDTVSRLERNSVPVTTISPALADWSSCGTGAAGATVGVGAEVSWAKAGAPYNAADAPAPHRISARNPALPRSERVSVVLILTRSSLCLARPFPLAVRASPSPSEPPSQVRSRHCAGDGTSADRCKAGTERATSVSFRL